MECMVERTSLMNKDERAIVRMPFVKLSVSNCLFGDKSMFKMI